MTYEKAMRFAREKAKRYNRIESVYMLDGDIHNINDKYVDNIKLTADRSGHQCKIICRVNCCV